MAALHMSKCVYGTRLKLHRNSQRQSITNLLPVT